MPEVVVTNMKHEIDEYYCLFGCDIVKSGKRNYCFGGICCLADPP
jgi:hypothetical protein